MKMSSLGGGQKSNPEGSVSGSGPGPLTKSQQNIKYRPAGFTDNSDDDDDFLNDDDDEMDNDYYSGPIPSSSTSYPKPDVAKLSFATGQSEPSNTTLNSRSIIRHVSSTSGTRAASGVSGKSAGPKSVLPQIPDIDRQRAIVATKSVNAAWNNVSRGTDAIYVSGISKTLRVEFKDAKNPYSVALNLMLYSFDFLKPPRQFKSLACEIINEFKKWLLDTGSMASFERKFLNPELQKITFTVITRQRNAEIYKLVSEVYCLSAIRQDFIQSINELCERGNYREACLAATYVGLYSEFDIHKFVIPLLLQDRESFVMEYLTSDANQNAVISFLDDILGNSSPSFALRNYALSRKIDEINYEKLEAKPLTKLLDRLHSKFKMDPLNCPNTGKRKRMSALRYLMYRKYTLMDPISEDAFEEMIDTTVSKEAEMLDEAFYSLRSNGDNVQAAKFAIRHAIPMHKIPRDVLEEMHKINPGVVTLPDKEAEQAWDEDWELGVPTQKQLTGSELSLKSGIALTPILANASKPGISNISQTAKVIVNSTVLDKKPSTIKPGLHQDQSLEMLLDLLEEEQETFYKCPIQLSNIHLLDTPDDIDIFIQHMEAAQISQRPIRKAETTPLVVVGFDSEWKPMMGAEGVALLQIATIDDVFLIDTYQLRQYTGTAERWIVLLEKFFKNERILKVGFGLLADMKMLAKTTPAWSNMKTDFKNAVDLADLAKQLLVTYPQFMEHFGSAGSALADLVRAFTNLRLNKAEQFSNWENRPLRDSQIIYAATDAYCVIDIFERMKVRAEVLNVNLDEMIMKLAKMPRSEIVTKGRGRARKVLTAKDLIQSGVQRFRDITVESSNDHPFRDPRKVSEIKLVCDNMHRGLGKQLRACGIDTLILENNESHARCVHLALQDDRCIVTSRIIHSQLAAYVPEGHCYYTIALLMVDQLREVLTYFNLTVSNVDLFTRCQNCNGDTFHKVRSSMLRELYPPNYRSSRSTGNNGDGCLEIDEELITETSGVGRAQDEKLQRRWVLLPESCLRHERKSSSVKTKSGAVVAINGIPPEIFTKVEHFYVCDLCGKCYWTKPRSVEESSTTPHTSN